ncbi:putative CBL-interacting protein kinase 13 [Hordeum vulgare]|nr:putative CBL-interacting protein kinase 13 [Hordeum vulgare]
MSLAWVWYMYEDENKLRLTNNLANIEENLKVLKEKEKMEKDLRFFKVDFAKMVAYKEEALAQLGNTQIALSDLKEELQKKSISHKSATNIHEVVRAKSISNRWSKIWRSKTEDVNFRPPKSAFWSFEKRSTPTDGTNSHGPKDQLQ